MQLRDKILYMSFGAGLVVLGMILNSLIGDANAQNNNDYASFKHIICDTLIANQSVVSGGTMACADTDGGLVMGKGNITMDGMVIAQGGGHFKGMILAPMIQTNVLTVPGKNGKLRGFFSEGKEETMLRIFDKNGNLSFSK